MTSMVRAIGTKKIDQSLWSDGAGLNLSWTFDELVMKLDDAHYGSRLPVTVAGATVGLDYALNFTNTSFGIPVNLALSSGTFNLDYAVLSEVALPDTVKRGDGFNVATRYNGFAAGGLALTSPNISLSAELMFQSSISGHLGTYWKDVPFIEDDGLALFGSTSDGGASYTDALADFNLSVPLLSIPSDGTAVLNQNLSVTEKTLGGRKVFRGPFASIDYGINLKEMEGDTRFSIQDNGLRGYVSTLTPRDPWLKLSLDIDDIAGSLLSLFPLTAAAGVFVSKLDSEYRVAHTILGRDLGTDISASLLSLNATLSFTPVLRMEFLPDEVLAKFVSSDGQVRVGHLGDTFSFIAPTDGNPLSITSSYVLSGTVKSSIGLLISGGIEGKFIGVEGQIFGVDIPGFFPDGSDRGTEADYALKQFGLDWNLSELFPTELSFEHHVQYELGQATSYDVTLGAETLVPVLSASNTPGSLAVTALEYGMFAANVYGTANHDTAGGINQVKSYQNTIPIPEGWAPIAYHDAHDRVGGQPDTGFLAAAYSKGDEIIVAYGGTTDENGADWTNGNLPAATGVNIFGQPYLAPQILQAAEFYLSVVNANPGKHVTFTGHSLGGGLASLMAVYFDKLAVVFDQAPFSKSADISAVVSQLRDALTADNFIVPTELADYVGGSGVVAAGTGASPSRVERQSNVTAFSIDGEILSLISEYDLRTIGGNRVPLYSLIADFMATHPELAAVSGLSATLGLGVVSAVSGPALIAAGAVVADHLLEVAGNGIGKIHGADQTVYDLRTPADPNLNWGWTVANEIPVLPDPVDLHSMSLLLGIMSSQIFLNAARTHPELIPSIFANADFPNDPKSNTPNLLDLFVQRQLLGGRALDILGGDVQRINLLNGMTATVQDPKFVDGINFAAILNRVELAGLYAQAQALGPSTTSAESLKSVLQRTDNVLTFDSGLLRGSLTALMQDLSDVLVVQSQLRGTHLLAGEYRDAVWAMQSGSGGVVYSGQTTGANQIVLMGGSENDHLRGTDGNDVISGNAGHDILYGLGGNDRLVAFDGGDQLFGGGGNDSYYLSRTVDSAQYDIQDTSGLDMLVISDITSFIDLKSIADLSFRSANGNLYIDILANKILFSDDRTTQGRIVIHNQAIDSSKVESMALFDDNGHPSGPTISLVSVWDAVQSFGDDDYHTLTLASTFDAYGTQVNGMDGTATGAGFTVAGNYDLALSLDAAKLSQFAYDSGTKLADELKALGWRPLKDGAGLLDVGGGMAADGVPNNHSQNAYAFAASRALPGDVLQFAISFRGSNSPITDKADWLDNNGGKFGFSYYYQQLQPVMVEMLLQALAAQAAGHKVQLLVTGHSLGGAAAEAAIADLLLAPGKDLWTLPAGEAAPLDAAHRIYANTSLAASVGVLQALAADAQAITFGAPSLLIDPNKPTSNDLAFLTAATPLLGVADSVVLLAALIAKSVVVNPGRTLAADPAEALNLANHLWQYEHEDSTWNRGADPVASLGTVDPGFVLDINLTEAIHARYEQFTSAPSMHSIDAYVESIARALTDSELLKTPNPLSASSPALPLVVSGTNGNNLIYVGPYGTGSGLAGNDILITKLEPGSDLTGPIVMNGGEGTDTYVIKDRGVTGLLDGPSGEAVDHLYFNMVGQLTADLQGDNVVLTMRSQVGADATVKVLGWFSGFVPYQVATIDQIKPYIGGLWDIAHYSFAQLGIPYYLTGTDSSDWVIGSHLDDEAIVGGLGFDRLDGREGDDTLYGDSLTTDLTEYVGASDEIYGGPGNDTLYGGAASDFLYGDQGFDTLYGGMSNDTLDGGPENESDYLYGNSGDDLLISRGGADWLSGGTGNDIYSIESDDGSVVTIADDGGGTDLLRLKSPGADFKNTLFYADGINLIVRTVDSSGSTLHTVYVRNMASDIGRIETLEVDLGNGSAGAVGRYDLGKAWAAALEGDNTGGKDAFIGTFVGGHYTGDGPDIIYDIPGGHVLNGYGGDDQIYAADGDDVVIGGDGDDYLDAGTGNDVVLGGSGNDHIRVVVDGTDTVSAGAGIDRLSADASTFNSYGYGRIWWEGTDAQGNAVAAVDVNSSFGAIQTYVQTATTNQLNMYVADSNWWFHNPRAATLTFSGVENLDLTASAAVNGHDLIFARGTGHYDGKGGIDAIYADLTAMTSAVRFVAGSDETYSYLGSTFAGFERFLVGTGSGDDYIDSTAVAMDDHLVLGSGNDTALTGGGNDWVDGGAGDDTIDGGAGNDTLTGGSGSDTFVYAMSGNGIDRITDIGRGDVIRIVGAALGGSVLAGDGTAVGLGQVQVSTVGTQTTLHIGTDAVAGADVVIRLDGVFAPSAVHATGDTITIDVPNNAPTGPIIGNLSDGVEDTPYSVGATQLLAGFSDLDGDALRVINLSSSAGTVEENGATEWLLAPPANYSGIVELSYEVVDDHGGSVQASRSITIAPVNDAPEASGPLSPAAATQGLAFAYTLPADAFTDAEGDVLSYSVTLLDGSALPAWLHFNEIGRSFSGTPGQIDVGILHIKVTASDGQATGSTVLQLDVANVNDAPVGASTHTWADGQEDTAYALSAVDLLQGFSDPDGDELVVGQLTSDHGRIIDDITTGGWMLTPEANYFGPVRLHYLVQDNLGGSVEAGATLNLQSVNDAPQGATDGALPSGFEDIAYTITGGQLLQGIEDADGDTLSIQNLSASQGTLAASGAGQWRLQTPLNFNGPIQLNYVVTDGLGGSLESRRSISFTAVDDASAPSSADVRVLETDAPIVTGNKLNLNDVDGGSWFLAQDATAGNYGVFRLDVAGAWTYTARMAYDYLSPGQYLSDVFQVRTSDGSSTTVKVTIDGTAESEFVRLGNAPVRQTGAGGQWEQAWTQQGFTILHKANVGNINEAWSAVKLTSVGSQSLAGGDIYAGDLGVSGQAAATSGVKQELDGTEALRVNLPLAAQSVTVKLSNFFLHDDGTLYSEAGLLRLLDSAGNVLGQKAFTAESLSGDQSVTFAAAQGFSSIELQAGAYDNNGHFVFGAYAKADGSFGTGPLTDAGNKLHGSDFLVHELDFVFPPAPVVGVVHSGIAFEG